MTDRTWGNCWKHRRNIITTKALRLKLVRLVSQKENETYVIMLLFVYIKTLNPNFWRQKGFISYCVSFTGDSDDDWFLLTIPITRLFSDWPIFICISVWIIRCHPHIWWIKGLLISRINLMQGIMHKDKINCSITFTGEYGCWNDEQNLLEILHFKADFWKQDGMRIWLFICFPYFDSISLI